MALQWLQGRVWDRATLHRDAEYGMALLMEAMLSSIGLRLMLWLLESGCQGLSRWP